MIDEENINQAIYEYASEKYGGQSKEIFQPYVDEFPEKDLEMPHETWTNNFLAWFFTEKVLPQTGMTIAEEFAENTPELSPEMKENVLQMKNIIRSKFIVISKKGSFLKIKDRKSGHVYNVKVLTENPISPNTVITGRIHPFGDHYRFAGVFQMPSPSSLILDPDVLFGAYENDQLKKVENLPLRQRSSLKSIMNKYPAHWIDWMCMHYDLEGGLKRDKVRRIDDKIINDLPRIVLKLPDKSKEALAFCVEQGGVVKYGKLKNYDNDMDFFWEGENPVSTIGMLRQKGLMVVGKMVFGDRNYKVAFIPVEIREELKSLLSSKNVRP